MEEKDIILFNKYRLSIETSVVGGEKPWYELNYTSEFNEQNKGNLPDQITEEVFDLLVEKLKQQLILEGKLLEKPIYPCNNCQFGWGILDTKQIKTCMENCQKLKKYNELFLRRVEKGIHEKN